MAMNQKVKRKWVKALRSGKYKQGFGSLRDKEDNFCALGVLCNLHAQANPDIANGQRLKFMYLGSASSLPYQVQAWAGLTDDNPVIGQGKHTSNLIELNDTKKLSFKEIAAAIEFSNL